MWPPNGRAVRLPNNSSCVGQYPGTCSSDSVDRIGSDRIVSYRNILCDIISYCIVSLMVVSCHHYYCGSKYRRSTGKEIVKVAVNTGQKKTPKSSEAGRCMYACTVRVLLR